MKMKKLCTLRELIVSCNLMEVYNLLHERHLSSALPTEKQNESLDNCVAAYKSVIVQMMMKPVKKACMPLYVSYVEEDEDKYYHVCVYNTKYQTPPKGKKPWHGVNHSEKYYNANLIKYHKFFGLTGNDWSSLVNADVIVDKSAINISNEKLIAEILWETTFYGFSEKETDKFVKNLKKIMDNEKKSFSKKKK